MMNLEKYFIPGKLYKIGLDYSLNSRNSKSLEFFGVIHPGEILRPNFEPNLLFKNNLVSNHLFLCDTVIINLGVYSLDYKDVFLKIT
jgi:hypothetical protein